MSRGGLPLVLAALATLAAGAARAQLGPEGTQGWHAGSEGLTTVPEEDARFGHATAAGDFDGDGFDDLAISSPYVTVDGDPEAGEVLVLYGGEGGLAAAGHQVWSQESTDMPDSANPNDAFGWAVAAGDIPSRRFAEEPCVLPTELRRALVAHFEGRVGDGVGAGIPADGVATDPVNPTETRR